MEASMVNLHRLIGAATRLRLRLHPRPNPTLKQSFSTHRMLRMPLRDDGPSIAIIAGEADCRQDFLSVIAERDFPYRSLKIFCCKCCAGKTMTFENKRYTMHDLYDSPCFDDVDIAMFNGGRSMSQEFAPLLSGEKPYIVVDDVEAFKLVETVVGQWDWRKLYKPS